MVIGRCWLVGLACGAAALHMKKASLSMWWACVVIQPVLTWGPACSWRWELKVVRPGALRLVMHGPASINYAQTG